MGKKKKREERIANMDPMYSQEINEKIADSFEAYCSAIKNFIIVEGRSKKDIDDSITVIKKAVKDLRNGKPEKVFDPERYALCMDYIESNNKNKEDDSW